MNRPENSLEQDLDPADTARIDRRGTVLAQLEAALLADRIQVVDTRREVGADPYDKGPAPRRDTWAAARRR